MDRDVTHAAFTRKVCALPDRQIRELCSENFILAANVLTYNWIEGNERANWNGKPFDWHAVASKDGRHHFEDWYDRLQRFELNMFLAARKHTKTTFADSLMIWKSEFVPGHQSLYWANTENQVEERMEELEEIVDANPWLQHVHTNNALKRKQFGNGSRILTTWVQGAFEGGHVDLMLGDDPMKEFADIPDERIEQWYGRVIVPTINPDGLMAIIGTRKRPTDLYELLRTKHADDDALEHLPSYNLTEYPAVREAWQAEYDRPGDLAPTDCYTTLEAPNLAAALGLDTETVSILWPDARPPEWLAKNLGGQGKSYFLREFCMIFKQAADAIVQRDWIARTTSSSPPPADWTEPWTPRDFPGDVRRNDFEEIIVGHDPAGAGRDRFAFVTIGTLIHPPEALPESLRSIALTDDGTYQPVALRHVLDAWQAQDVPPSRWRDKLTALHDRYGPDEIAIESNLNATWTADDDEIPRRVRNVITPVATTRRKHSWKDGVPNIGSEIEAGRYRFYDGGEAMTEDLITALTSVQRSEGELVGHTPDLVMAMYMAHRRLKDLDGYATSSRTSLTGGTTEHDRERQAQERSKRKALRGNPIGDALIESADQSF